jgi:hypothetical protein
VIKARAITITCDRDGCADHLHFPDSTVRLANLAARKRGWRILTGADGHDLCPAHARAERAVTP